MSSAQKVVLIGPMGAGKTSLGKRLAARLGWRFIDTDQAICVRTGVDIPTIFSVEGEAGFRAREREMLAEILAIEQDIVVACGGGIVLDAENRKRIMQQKLVVFLDVSVDRQIERVGRDRNRPLVQQHNQRQHLQSMREARLPLYKMVANVRVSTDSNHFPFVLRQLVQVAQAHIDTNRRRR